MARQNYVTLHGQVMSDPVIYTDEGVPVRALFYLTIMERPNYNPDGSKSSQRYDCPIVISLNRDIIEKIAKLKKYDMVDVTGVLCTIRTNKKNFCKACGKENQFEGQGVYVNPIYVCKRESDNMDTRKGRELLRERAEISNTVYLIGNLCNDPEYYEESGRIANCSYSLAVNRKIRIAEDPDSMTTDFPWIKTFGSMAVEDHKRLQKGSCVYIHGMLRTRRPERTFTCQHCGETYVELDNVVDIVPYSVEYLNNLKPSEEDGDVEVYYGDEEESTVEPKA